MPAGAPTPLVWTPELVARFWDWESGRTSHYFAEQYGAGIVATFDDLLSRSDVVLDFGCGAGGLLRHLLPRAAKVIGVDPSPASRAEVERRFGGQPHFGGVRAPEALESLAGTIDLLFCVEVVEHLYDDVLASLLATIRRLLKPDGVAIFTTPNQEDLAGSEILCPQCHHVFHRWQHVRRWDKESLAQPLAAGGFALVRAVETDFRAHPAVDRGKAFRRWLKKLRGQRVRTPHLACAVNVADTTASPARA